MPAIPKVKSGTSYLLMCLHVSRPELDVDGTSAGERVDG